MHVPWAWEPAAVCGHDAKDELASVGQKSSAIRPRSGRGDGRGAVEGTAEERSRGRPPTTPSSPDHEFSADGPPSSPPSSRRAAGRASEHCHVRTQLSEIAVQAPVMVQLRVGAPLQPLLHVPMTPDVPAAVLAHAALRSFASCRQRISEQRAWRGQWEGRWPPGQATAPASSTKPSA